ncbi:hypothetical protein PWJ47_06965 [Fructilactobacillus sanfranciscensis]
MEEKHEIIAPNFISKPSSMSSPTHAPYKHIAAKVESGFGFQNQG